MPVFESKKILNNLQILFTERQIQDKVAELAREISREYENDSLLAVGILNGSALFLADLVRCLQIPLEYDFVGLSSYVGSESSGVIEVTRQLKTEVKGKRALIVEDIIDTGRTLAEGNLIASLLDKGAADVKLCSLLDKPSRRTHPVTIDFKGYEIENLFVVGYGLDYNGFYRNLPYIGYFPDTKD